MLHDETNAKTMILFHSKQKNPQLLGEKKALKSYYKL